MLESLSFEGTGEKGVRSENKIFSKDTFKVQKSPCFPLLEIYFSIFCRDCKPFNLLSKQCVVKIIYRRTKWSNNLKFDFFLTFHLLPL